MNRYPLWKYLLIGLVIVVSAIYALPNLYGETPAVQVSTNRQSIHIDQTTEQAVEEALKAANIQHNGMFIADGSLKVRFKDSQTQMKARSVIENALGEGYITAERTKMVSNNCLFMENGRYSTCDNHDHPHFYFMLTKGKARPQKEIGFCLSVEEMMGKHVDK